MWLSIPFDTISSRPSWKEVYDGFPLCHVLHSWEDVLVRQRTDWHSQSSLNRTARHAKGKLSQLEAQKAGEEP